MLSLNCAVLPYESETRKEKSMTMSFTGFYPETIDFLWGIRLNNNREWFEAHKADYQRFLWEPMKRACGCLFEVIEWKCACTRPCRIRKRRGCACATTAQAGWSTRACFSS